jgi:hypothetical protein
MQSMEVDRSPRPPSAEGIGAARDLTVQGPRSFGLELEGYAHLRIPADVPWRVENTGARTLRAVAVTPAAPR